MFVCSQCQPKIRIDERKGSMKSITQFQRQDFYNKENIEPPKAANKYRTINTNHQNWNFNKQMHVCFKLENSIVERLEKSTQLESIFKQEQPRRHAYSK